MTDERYREIEAKIKAAIVRPIIYETDSDEENQLAIDMSKPVGWHAVAVELFAALKADKARIEAAQKRIAEQQAALELARKALEILRPSFLDVTMGNGGVMIAFFVDEVIAIQAALAAMPKQESA